jgi:hypothetical protein
MPRRNDRREPRTEPRRGPVSYGKSMISVAVLPRRYYLVPLSVGAEYLTVTALPRLIERRDQRKGAARRPLVVTVAALAIAGRTVLRAAGHAPRGVQRTR